jgi:uncharacterized protein YndB with AHSA1/START domain
VQGRPGPTWTIAVNVPPEKAYAYIADLSRHGEWASQADEMTIKADQPGEPTVGKSYSAEGKLLGKRNASKVTITALDPPRTLEFEYVDPNNTSGGHVFTFTPQNGGTLITRQIFGIKQPFYGPLLFRIFKGKIDVTYNGALQNLKSKLESAPAQPAAEAPAEPMAEAESSQSEITPSS